jgi:hypothetical protein
MPRVRHTAPCRDRGQRTQCERAQPRSARQQAPGDEAQAGEGQLLAQCGDRHPLGRSLPPDLGEKGAAPARDRTQAGFHRAFPIGSQSLSSSARVAARKRGLSRSARARRHAMRAPASAKKPVTPSVAASRAPSQK